MLHGPQADINVRKSEEVMKTILLIFRSRPRMLTSGHKFVNKR